MERRQWLARSGGEKWRGDSGEEILERRQWRGDRGGDSGEETVEREDSREKTMKRRHWRRDTEKICKSLYS